MEPRADFRVAILHPTEPLVATAAGTLPAVDITGPRVQRLDLAMAACRDQLGVPFTPLRWEALVEPRPLALALVGFAEQPDLAEGLDWSPDVTDEYAQLVASIIGEEHGALRIPEARPGWARRGWRERTEAWIRDSVGHSAAITWVRQWSISALARVETPAGVTWLKAMPHWWRMEGRVLADLMELAPAFVPTVVAHNEELHTLLLADAGLVDSELDEVRLEDGGIEALARLQIAALPHTSDLIARGWEDRSFATMSLTVRGVMCDAEELSELEPRERERLAAVLDEVTWALGRRDHWKVPATVTHGDFHIGNVAEPADPVIIDWSDGCIAHPFTDLVTLYRYGELQPGEFERLRDLYLAPWEAALDHDHLLDEFDDALMFGHLFLAESYRRIHEWQEDAAWWELGGATADLLRGFLELWERRPARLRR